VNRRMTATSIACMAVIALGIGSTVSSAASGATATTVKLKTVKGFPTELRAPSTANDIYDVDERITPFCGQKGGTPIAAGWTDAGAPVSSIETVFNSTNPYLAISTRRPMASATIRPLAICAKGKINATVKSKDSGTVSCGRKLAIGIPLTSTWPYNEQATEAKPVGKHGWTTNALDSDSTAICVAVRAFAKVKTVKGTKSFVVGANSATARATCPGKRRPLGWGFSAPTMDGNAWDSSDTTSRMTVPFVSGAGPAGKRGWKLTFRTPNGQGAAATAQVALHLTCGVPR